MVLLGKEGGCKILRGEYYGKGTPTNNTAEANSLLRGLQMVGGWGKIGRG